MRVHFARHGHSEANQRHVISNRRLPHPLTAQGCGQAAALARSLAGAPLVAAYSSPIPRAAETAQIVAAAHGLPLAVEDALREPDCGVMEGRGDAEAWAEHDRVLAAWLDGVDDARIDGGESLQEVRARFVPFVDRLVASHGDTAGDVLVVTHGSLLRLMLPVVLVNLPPWSRRDTEVPPAGVVVAEARSGVLVCLRWCGRPVRALW